MQGDSERKRGRYISKIQEYELDIKPTKLIKGQGLANILLESNCQALRINLVAHEDEVELQHNDIKTSEQKIYTKY